VRLTAPSSSGCLFWTPEGLGRLKSSTTIIATLLCCLVTSFAQNQVYVVTDSAAPCLRLRAQANHSATEIDCLAPSSRPELGKPVQWIGVAPSQASAIAASLLRTAEEAEQQARKMKM